MTKKLQDDAPVIVRVTKINGPLPHLQKYVDQEATVDYNFNIGRETFISAIFSDGTRLSLDPNQYEVISGTLTPQSSNYMPHRRAQQLRMNKAARRYAKRARGGRTQQY